MKLKHSALLASMFLVFSGAAFAQKQPIYPGYVSTVVPTAGDCSAPTGTISATGTITGNNSGGPNNVSFVDPDAGCSEYIDAINAGGPEDVYVITPGTGNALTFTLTGGGAWDPMMYILATCGDASSCVEGSDDATPGGSNLNPRPLSPSLTAGNTYFVYVDSWYGASSSNSSGPYTLNVSGTFPVTLTEFSID